MEMSIPIINPEAEEGTSCGTCGHFDHRAVSGGPEEGYCWKHHRHVSEEGVPCFNYRDEEFGLLIPCLE